MDGARTFNSKTRRQPVAYLSLCCGKPGDKVRTKQKGVIVKVAPVSIVTGNEGLGTVQEKEDRWYLSMPCCIQWFPAQ